MAMSEIPQAGYENLRDRILGSWSWIALLDGADQEAFRLPATVPPTDSRVTVTETGGLIQYQVVLRGDDPEIGASETRPRAIGGSRIHNVDTGGEPLSLASFSPFTFNHAQDRLTVFHDILLPGTRGVVVDDSKSQHVADLADVGSYYFNTAPGNRHDSVDYRIPPSSQVPWPIGTTITIVTARVTINLTSLGSPTVPKFRVWSNKQHGEAHQRVKLGPDGINDAEGDVGGPASMTAVFVGKDTSAGGDGVERWFVFGACRGDLPG